MKILLVRLRLIGDVVFTTPVVPALKRLRPSAHVTYLVERAAAPVVAHLPELDRVIQIDHTRGWARVRDDLALGRRLRRERFDLVLDFHGGPRGAWLSWATRAPVRVGYTIAGRSWMYTHLVPRARDLRPRHSVENQWDLLRAAFPEAGDPDPERDRVVMAEDPDARDAIMHRLAGAGGHRPGRRSRRDPRQRGQPFPPVARRRRSRTWRSAFRRAERIVVSS